MSPGLTKSASSCAHNTHVHKIAHVHIPNCTHGHVSTNNILEHADLLPNKLSEIVYVQPSRNAPYYDCEEVDKLIGVCYIWYK